MSDQEKDNLPASTEERMRQRRRTNFGVRAELTRDPDFDGEKTIYLTYNGRQEYANALAPHEAQSLVDLLCSEFKINPCERALGCLPAIDGAQSSREPASSDAAIRVKAYIERRKRARGIDINHIHSFDAGPDCGIELLLSDLEALVSESPAAKA